MDLLDFSENSLYFDEPLAESADLLIKQAASEYSDRDVEPLLIEAYKIAPEHLSVLVALYRYYYYQHRLGDALHVAHQALTVSGRRLDFPTQWQKLTDSHLGAGALVSMGMVRFYLLALKATGYLNLRMKKWETAFGMLKKLTELDKVDRLGTNSLLEIAESVYQSENQPRASM